MNRLAVSASLMSLILAGCGGGGSGAARPDSYSGSGITNPYLRTSVPFYTPQRVGTFQPLVNGDFRLPVDDIFVRDLNRNGVDEVVFAGRLTQPNTAENWRNYNMQIYGWNSGSFANETTSWFRGNDNHLIGTEPAVKFGDFNGNGHTDMLVPHSTDTNIYGPTAIFLNTGNSGFTRTDIDLGNVWSHDASVGDFNNNGITDFFVTDYSGRPAIVLGSADNNFQVLQASSGPSASGVAAADFLGNGTTTFVMTDVGSANAKEDIKLFSWSASGSELIMTEVATLPTPRLWADRWAAARANSDFDPHEIRVISLDFSNNGLPDVVVISTLPERDATFANTGIQFLKNQGNGVFVDVTDDILVGYDPYQAASYNPVIVDINNDGLLDILLSARSFTEGQPFASVLLQTAEGKFVNSFSDVFVDFANQIKSTTSVSRYNTPLIGIVVGPDNEKYLVSTLSYDDENDVVQNAVYLARLGTTGTVTVPATIATVQKVWPWMSAAEVNEVLARTSPLSINGSQVIDPWAAMSPVGMLGLALDGRHGMIRPLSGYIAGVNFRSAQLRVAALDSLRRDFQVDLSTMNVGRFNHWTRTEVHRQNYTAPSISHAQNLVGTSVSEINGYRVAQHPDDTMGMFTIGSPGVRITEKFSLHTQMTMLNFSPWLQMDGVWGKVNNTIISELVGSYRHRSFVANTGLMYAITEITPGLVTNVSNIASVWGEVGFQDQKTGFAGFVGIKPWALNGHVNAKIPTSIDQQGNLQYQDVKAPIQNSLDGYLRVGYTAKLHSKVRGSIGTIMFTNGLHGVMGSLNITF